MMRRSLATGCWRASRSKARWSSSSRRRVDGVVGRDHALGEGQVGVEQSGGRPVDRRADQPGHLDQLVAQSLELLVVSVAHQVILRRRRDGVLAQSTARSVPAPVNEHRRRGEHQANRSAAAAERGRIGRAAATYDRCRGRARSSDSAAVVGVLVGAAAVLATRVSEREQRTVPVDETAPAPVLPAGVADVLAVLRSSAVVLDADDRRRARQPGGVRVRARHASDRLVAARPARAGPPGTPRRRDPRGASSSCPAGRSGPPRSPCWPGSRRSGRRSCSLLVEDRTEARRVDAVRRDFVANVSHELKTPVGALALLAEALVDAADDPEAVRRFAGRMQHESERLTRLVQDVIELSRLQGHDPLRGTDAGRARRRGRRGGGPQPADRRGARHRPGQRWRPRSQGDGRRAGSW